MSAAVSDNELLDALGIRVAVGDIEEEAIWCGKHRVLVLDREITSDQILALAGELLVESPSMGEERFLAEATLDVFAGDKDLPGVGVEQLFDYIDGEWVADCAPRIFLSGRDESTALRHYDDARALAGALSQAADTLAGILAEV